MNKPPIAGPRPEGRVFGTDWSIANVATLVRSHAGRGLWRRDSSTGGYANKINQHYLRTVSVRHLPTNVTLIFMRLEEEKCWYASLCFSGVDEYLPWNEDAAELWLSALFGPDRKWTSWEPGVNGSVRQFSAPF